MRAVGLNIPLRHFLLRGGMSLFPPWSSNSFIRTSTFQHLVNHERIELESNVWLRQWWAFHSSLSFFFFSFIWLTPTWHAPKLRPNEWRKMRSSESLWWRSLFGPNSEGKSCYDVRTKRLVRVLLEHFMVRETKIVFVILAFGIGFNYIILE